MPAPVNKCIDELGTALAETHRFRLARHGACISSWEVLHSLPGRLRVRDLRLKDQPETAGRLELELRGRPGVLSASARSLTGTLVLQFNPNVLRQADALRLLDQAVAALARRHGHRLDARQCPMVDGAGLARRGAGGPVSAAGSDSVQRGFAAGQQRAELLPGLAAIASPPGRFARALRGHRYRHLGDRRLYRGQRHDAVPAFTGNSPAAEWPLPAIMPCRVPCNDPCRRPGLPPTASSSMSP